MKMTQTSDKQPPRQTKLKPGWLILAILIVIGLILTGLYQEPYFKQRADYTLKNLQSRIFYLFRPPSEAVFNPSQQNLMNTLVAGTLSSIPSAATPTNLPAVSQPQLDATPTPLPTLLLTQTMPPLPDHARIIGVPFEFQTFNNCGPDNLAMLVSYWGWPTKQVDTAAILKTHKDDRNVMLSEMLSYTQSQTDLKGVIRFGGTIETIKRLVSAGFPVLLERGHTDPEQGWMGHYSIVTGYDDAIQSVFIPDTLLGDTTMLYDELALDWAHFDNMYLLVYPASREREALSLLADQADPAINLQFALAQVTARLDQVQGRESFFAWFSRGSILVQSGDYLEASQAYDQAFAIYGQLPAGERPWRLTWYQVGPYEAYFNVGRYQDVLTLAQQTLDNCNLDSLPETWFWAGKAAAALGQNAKAEGYFRGALEYYPGWPLALEGLAALGVTP